jgi:hypothetical protein
MTKEKKHGIFTQIVVAVVIALLVGGAAPWWWPYVFGSKDVAPPDPNGAGPPVVPVEPSSDFPGGTKRVYSADFSRWPTKKSEHGLTTLGFANSYVIQPYSNTWLGPGQHFDIPVIEGDFVFDTRFRIEARHPSTALKIDLTGGGADAESVSAYFYVWDDDNVTYTLTLNRVRSGGDLAVPHVITEETFAEREKLPLALYEGHDWSKGCKLTLKREGGQMQFFVNDKFVKQFRVSLFPLMKMSVGVAFESRIVITSIEARVTQQ